MYKTQNIYYMYIVKYKKILKIKMKKFLKKILYKLFKY